MDSNPICPLQYKESWILSELPISSDLQLFQSFPTEEAQNDSERPILPDLQLFQSFSTKVAQIIRQCTQPLPHGMAQWVFSFSDFSWDLVQYLDDDLHILVV